MDWTTFFADVPDSRLNRRERHLLLDILVVNLLAIICGADDRVGANIPGKCFRLLDMRVLLAKKWVVLGKFNRAAGRSTKT